MLVVREKNKGQATSNEDTEEIIEDMTVSIIEEGIKPTSLSVSYHDYDIIYLLAHVRILSS